MGNIPWIQLTGVSQFEISSQINQRYLQVLKYQLTKEEDVYRLELELESDTKVAISFTKIKALVS